VSVVAREHRHALPPDTADSASDRPQPQVDESSKPGSVRREQPESLGDVFARLLAAEQGEPPPPPGSVPFRLSDADVERVAARVVERFDATLRDEVRRLVAEAAQRLIREEIDRIRRAAESGD
jgi:hypothetical protein